MSKLNDGAYKSLQSKKIKVKSFADIKFFNVIKNN
jgi:hypothetical protein